MSQTPILEDIPYEIVSIDDHDNQLEYIDLSENIKCELESDVEIPIKPLQLYECYVCKQMKSHVVKPCKTKNCSARICPECIKIQVKTYNNTKCGLCTKQIVITRKAEINYNKCLEAYIKIFYVLFMFVIGPIITFLNALGKTINLRWINCNPTTSPCDDGAVGTIFFVILFIIPIWQGHLTGDGCCKCSECSCAKCGCRPGKCCRYDIFCCGSLRQKLKYKSYLTILIMFFISNGLIVLAHCIGQPIIKSLFNNDDFYTWRTSLAGFVLYTGLIALGFIMIIIYGIYQCLMDNAKQNFSDVEYGVEVHNENTILV